jgi:hypothetical protein
MKAYMRRGMLLCSVSISTAAAMAGVSERVNMRQTGHKNTAMPRRYIRAGSLLAVDRISTYPRVE